MELTLQEKLRLIEFFEFLLNEEISKPLSEMSSEAVDNYIKILLHLQDKHVELSSEFIDEQVRKIFHKEESAAPETAKTTKKVINKKKVWLVAACLALLVAFFSIASFSSERTVVDVLEDFLGSYDIIPWGKEVTIDKESYGKESDAENFKSIEELTKAQKIDLLYPTSIQDSINLIYTGVVDKKENIYISYNNSDLFIRVTLNSEISPETIDFCNEKIYLDGIEYYLCIMEDFSKAQAYFEYDNNLYVITHSDKEYLLEILNNMEEIKYED